MKRKNRHYAKSRKYKAGDRVWGVRSPDAWIGTFVEMYVTINENEKGVYRNPAYVIRCDVDGEERSFQSLKKIDKFQIMPYHVLHV